MNSPRTMPCVLVLPPRSKPPGFQRPRICAVKLAMIESRNSSSSGSGFSSAIFKPSSLRCLLINAVTSRAIGSRSMASNAGRIQGSMRRSICKRNIVVSLTQLRKREPVLARGIGRLTFEFTAPPMAVRSDYADAGNSSAKSINRFFAQINFAKINVRRDSRGSHRGSNAPRSEVSE